MTFVGYPDQAEKLAIIGGRCQGPRRLKKSHRAGVVIPSSPLLSSTALGTCLTEALTKLYDSYFYNCLYSY